MNSAEGWLKCILRVVAILFLVTVVPVVMPRSWVVRGVDLAEPGTPVRVLVPCFVRVLFAYNVLVGGLLLIFATDVRKFAGCIRVLALWILLGSVIFVFHAGPGLFRPGMGWFFWAMSIDFACAFTFGVTLILLQRRVAKQPGKGHSGE
jgi:hypothetical protein